MLGKEPHGVVWIVDVAFFTVGASANQHREFTWCVRPKYIGGQTGTVAHRHHYVSFADNLVFGLLRYQDVLREIW